MFTMLLVDFASVLLSRPERNKSFTYLPVTLKLHSITSMRSFPIYSAGWREATNELERGV